MGILDDITTELGNRQKEEFQIDLSQYPDKLLKFISDATKSTGEAAKILAVYRDSIDGDCWCETDEYHQYNSFHIGTCKLCGGSIRQTEDE